MALWLPFKPASYNSYQECMRLLYRQGLSSMYKGNLVRSVHILAFHKANTFLAFQAESSFGLQWKKFKETPLLAEFLLSSVVDMCLQPLHVAETRFIMQNSLPNFASNPSVKHYFTKTPIRDMFRAGLLHIPRNFLIALSGLKLQDEITLTSYFGQTFAS